MAATMSEADVLALFAVAMGLVMLDNPAVEDLARAVAAEGRSSFLLTCAPLPIPGATGSPVNPLAVF